MPEALSFFVSFSLIFLLLMRMLPSLLAGKDIVNHSVLERLLRCHRADASVEAGESFKIVSVHISFCSIIAYKSIYRKE